MKAIDLQAARRALASCRVDGIEAPLGEWAELAALERRGDIVIGNSDLLCMVV